jgi:hypothetical protein
MDKIKQLLKQIDIFGYELKVNFRGQESGKSACGGFTLIVTYSVLFAYFLSLTTQMFRHDMV